MMAVAVVGLSLWAAPVGAQDADSLIRRGVDLRRTGDDEGGLRLFHEAYRAAPSGRALAQIGFAEQALGRWNDALGHLDQALQQGSEPWVIEHRAAIEEARGLVASHAGSTGATSPATGATSPASTTSSPGDGGDSGGDTLGIIGWTSLALGVVTLALGVAALGVREANAAWFNDDDVCLDPALPMTARRDQCPDALAAVRLAEILGGVGLGVGGGLAVLGAVLGAVGMTSNNESSAFLCGPGGLGVVCGGSF